LVVNGQPYSPKIAIGNGTAGIAVDGNGTIIPSPGSDAIIEATPLGDEANVTLALCPDTAKVRVYTYSASNHALADRGFQILFDNYRPWLVARVEGWTACLVLVDPPPGSGNPDGTPAIPPHPGEPRLIEAERRGRWGQRGRPS
jgi:hypothetical protein